MNDKKQTGQGTGRIRTTPTRARATVDWVDAFLKALEETGVIAKAAGAANISRSAVWERRKQDGEFREKFEASLIAGALLLEAEAIRRARDGVRPIKFNPKTGEPFIDPATGEPYVEYEFSDNILLALLRRHFPEYRDKPTEANVNQAVNSFTLTVEQQRELQERRRIALGR